MRVIGPDFARHIPYRSPDDSVSISDTYCLTSPCSGFFQFVLGGAAAAGAVVFRLESRPFSRPGARPKAIFRAPDCCNSIKRDLVCRRLEVRIGIPGPAAYLYYLRYQ